MRLLSSFCVCVCVLFLCISVASIIPWAHSFATECISFIQIATRTTTNHVRSTPHLLDQCAALAHEMNARPLGINLMIYNCWNYEWTMNCNLSSLNLRNTNAKQQETQTFKENEKPLGHFIKSFTPYFTRRLLKKRDSFCYIFLLFPFFFI